MSNDVTLSVFFCGTSRSIKPKTLWEPLTQVSIFSDLTIGKDITDPEVPLSGDEEQLKMSFDGCGVEFGCRGSLFAHGLEQQCQKVVDRVLELIKSGKKVKLNCLGSSRGGIAEMMLTKMLADIDKFHLETNLILFDPVPGNLLISKKLDFLGNTVASQVTDLSMSKNLNRVLAIYPHEPLPDLAFHAPIIPKYPNACQVEQDVVPGCHEGALFQPSLFHLHRKTFLTYVRIKSFLEECGTDLSEYDQFSESEIRKLREVKDEDCDIEPHLTKEEEEKVCLKELNELHAQRKQKETVRAAHSFRSTQIVKSSYGKFFNRYHQELAEKYPDSVQPLNEDDEKQEQQYMMHVVPALDMQPFTLEKLTKECLESFLDEAINGMSERSKSSRKGDILKDIRAKLSDSQANDLTQESLSYVLRNALTTILQRDRNFMSPFHTTRSGWSALEKLKTEQFKAIKDIIAPGQEDIRYRDLRKFSLGSNNEGFFNSGRKERVYDAVSGIVNENVSKDGFNRYREMMNP